MATSSDYTIDSQQLLPRPSIFSNTDDEDHEALLPSKNEYYRDEPNTPRDPSPPPSPRSPRPITFIRALVRILPWMFVLSVLGWMSSAFYYEVRTFKTNIKVVKWTGDEVQEIYNDTLPGAPMPVIVEDHEGQPKWTVSIPSWLEFPLKPEQYAEICAMSKNYSEHLDVNRSAVASYSYYHVDQFFMEVAEAEDLGLLPTNPITKWSSTGSSTVDANNSNIDAAGYCKRSLTFNLETTEAGLGSTLSLLWMSYGLAKKENRAFFVDDRNWAYGKYSAYFQPVPNQGCLPPPEHHKLPCPHHADHLVVSYGMQSEAFGHAFNEEYENPKKMRVERQEWIFGLMRHGYEDLFRLTDSDSALVDARTSEIREQVGGGVEIGVHVRHGDKHPWEVNYERSYIPMERFIQVAWEMAEDAHNESLSARGGVYKDLYSSKMVLASDDPLVYWSDDMSLAIPAQENIILGQDAILEAGVGEDESSPWEGGFTAEKFWNVDDLSSLMEERSVESLAARDFDGNGQRVQASANALKLRERMGRAYLMDLSILSKTDRIVCTMSSIGCRLLAVMQGWDKAIEKGHWRNIDGQWFWKGIRW